MKNTLSEDEVCTPIGFEDSAKVNTHSILTRGMAVHICSLEEEFSREQLELSMESMNIFSMSWFKTVPDCFTRRLCTVSEKGPPLLTPADFK
jgi:hypothetical protein